MGAPDREVLTMLIAGGVVFSVLSGIMIFILLFYQKKRFAHRLEMGQMKNEMEHEVLRAQLSTQENTFRQIADELHDNVGQLLSSANILLIVTQKKLPDPPDSLQTASETLMKAMQDLRSLSKSLNREWLQRFNLVENLQAEADRINMSRSITVGIIAQPARLPLTAEAQLLLFRIIQEAMQNCIKHAEAQSIKVTIDIEEKKIHIYVEDDGKGFSPGPDHSAGLGLLNMRHRTSLLGGSIEWRSAEEKRKGTKVQICLPVQIHDT